MTHSSSPAMPQPWRQKRLSPKSASPKSPRVTPRLSPKSMLPKLPGQPRRSLHYCYQQVELKQASVMKLQSEPRCISWRAVMLRRSCISPTTQLPSSILSPTLQLDRFLRAPGYPFLLPPLGGETSMLLMSWVVSSPGHPPLIMSRLTKVSVLKMLGTAEISSSMK